MAATDWVRPEIAELSAYHVAPARDMRKLDAMETRMNCRLPCATNWRRSWRRPRSTVIRIRPAAD